MAERNTHPATGIAPATRIPLYLVEAALHRAAAAVKAKTALQAALARVPMNDWPLRDAIRDAATAAGFAQFSAQIFDRYAVGVNHD